MNEERGRGGGGVGKKKQKDVESKRKRGRQADRQASRQVGGNGRKITGPGEARENKGCLSTPQFLSLVTPFILSVSVPRATGAKASNSYLVSER